jgi:hypothetical protein
MTILTLSTFKIFEDLDIHEDGDLDRPERIAQDVCETLNLGSNGLSLVDG